MNTTTGTTGTATFATATSAATATASGTASGTHHPAGPHRLGRRNVRRIVATTLLAAVSAGSVIGFGAPGADAAATQNTTILVVHGFDGGGLGDVPLDSAVDCTNSVMMDWVNGLRARGFTDVRTVGYYQGDRNCDVNLAPTARADNTINTSIDQIAREFADMIAANFTARNVNVAISAHSMGGMVVRRALHGVQDHHAGFPARLLVSDVVTSGSPHAGASVTALCGLLPGALVPTQCSQLVPGSPFLQALANNPQATGGTDWTVIGSDCDSIVSGASAVSMTRVSLDRPSVFQRRFAAPSFFAGGCLLGAAGFDHTELVTAAAPLNVIRDGLLTNN